MTGLTFRLLGPLDVLDGDNSIPLKSARQRVVLTVLLMAANHVVSMERLIDAVWDGEPPPTARAQIQICISALRRTLGDPDLITTAPGGYSIGVRPEQLDYVRFDETVALAHAEAERGDLDDALRRLDEGLALWRGPALTGVPGRTASAMASKLEERRITAVEHRLEVRLRIGTHGELVGELITLTNEHPLRERLWGMLMLALYRSGRQAEALKAYHTARRLLMDELGLEPSVDLRHLEHSILTHASELDLPDADDQSGGARGPVPPRQLPPDLPDFVGREDLVEELADLVTGTRPADGSGADVPVVVLTGLPGAGKSTVAVRVAHQVRDSFPDGQLFTSMRGHSSQPTPPMQVLFGFLQALGVSPDAIPAAADDRSSLFRSLLADRRILLVLDDAADEEHLQGLLPGGPGPSVLISSRTRLAGLPSPHIAELGLMPAGDAVRLLERVGPKRCARERDETARLARLCGNLPLALRIAAVRLTAHPHWSVATLVELLADEHNRLDELSHGDLGVRPLLGLIYDSLSPRAQQLFRFLGGLDLHDFSAPVAAALLDADRREASRLLEELVDARLLGGELRGGGRLIRYHFFHDLIRVFAAECLKAEEGSGRPYEARIERTLSCVLALAGEALQRIHGGAYTMVRGTAPRWPGAQRHFEAELPEPMRWLDEERANLRAAIFQAARLGLSELCWELAIHAVALYEIRAYFDDWRDTHMAALGAVRAAGNTRGEATILTSLGELGIAQHSEDDIDMQRAALALFEEVDDPYGQAVVLRNLAHIDRIHGNPERALERYERALAGFRETADHGAQAYILSGMARARLDLHHLEEAERLAKNSLAISQRMGSRRSQAQALFRLGEVFITGSQLLAARPVLQQALDLSRQFGDRTGEAYCLNGLGTAELELGDLDASEGYFTQAVEICRTGGERNVYAHAVFGLGHVYEQRGEHGIAERYFGRAANAFAAQENHPWRRRAIESLHSAREAAVNWPRSDDTR